MAASSGEDLPVFILAVLVSLMWRSSLPCSAAACARGAGFSCGGFSCGGWSTGFLECGLREVADPTLPEAQQSGVALGSSCLEGMGLPGVVGIKPMSLALQCRFSNH